MTIQEFIKNEIIKRIQAHRCIIFYDHEIKYKEIINSISEYEIVDGSQSTILSREVALEKFIKLDGKFKGLLIYLPIKRPDKEIEQLANPYLIFEIGGSYFPKGDSDSFYSLCQSAFPDKRENIDKVFANHSNPDFEVINTSVKGDKSYPIICSLLNVHSTVEILTAILSPNANQLNSLSSSDHWQNELKVFLKEALDYSLTTRSKQLESIQDELWRVVLFTEFAFDLPTELPAPLANIPRLDKNHEKLIFVLCEELRQHTKHQEHYANYAIQIEKDLSLREHCKHVVEFGKRDTFEFEERTFLTMFVNNILSNNISKAKEIYVERQKSIWVEHSEERQLLWTLAGKSLEFINLLEQSNILLSEYSKDLNCLITGYAEKLYKIDKIQREYEQLVADSYYKMYALSDLVDKLRGDYDKYFGSLHKIFIQKVSQEGWPANGHLRNTILFNKFIDPVIKERKKVAFFMVDSLRYELAIDLYDKLSGYKNAEIKPVCAQLPTTTKFGMASLLPNADGNLTLKNSGDCLVPYIGDNSITASDDRITYIKKVYGDISSTIWIDDLIKYGQKEINENINLLIIKTTDIDDLGESMPNEAIALIPKMIQKIYASISTLHSLGFEKIFIATDHGFILKTNYALGDNVPKPAGNWIESKRRYLLGKGESNSSTLCFDPSELGIKTECKNYITPKSYHAFNKGTVYYHEGLSLQECILPIISITLKPEVDEESIPYSLVLSYKSGKTNEITSRRPMVELTISSDELFGSEVEVLLIAYSKENIVGESSPSQYLDLASNTLKLKTGNIYKLPMKMLETFEGEFEVRASNPQTNITYTQLNLKTNYMD